MIQRVMNSHKYLKLRLLLKIFRIAKPKRLIVHWLKILFRSESQLFQELFVASVLGLKKQGFFVEVGGTDGILMSNTLILEQMGWKGVIFEPCKYWHSELSNNRNCLLDFRAVTDQDHQKLKFSETLLPELSTITSMKPDDFWTASRLNSKDYLVDTITLNVGLSEIAFPTELDYLSIDTEGSELEVLMGLNMRKYQIKVITVEHAGDRVKQEKIKTLLQENGYQQIFEGETFWDDWYLHDSLYNELKQKGRLIEKQH